MAEAAERLLMLQALVHHGYPVEEARETLRLFIRPPEGKIVLDGVFFDGMNKTLDEELASKLFALSPVRKVTFSSVPRMVPAEEWMGALRTARELREIDVERCPMSRFTIGGLSERLKEGRIRKLRLDSTDIAANAAYYGTFLDALAASRLEALEMPGNRAMTPERVRDLTAAVSGLGLKSLDLTRLPAGGEAFESLPLTLERLKLTELAAPGPELTARMTGMRALKEIDLEKCTTSPEALTAFFEALPQTGLEKLNLYKITYADGGKIGDDAADALIAAMSLPDSRVYETGLTHQTKELGRPLYAISPDRMEKIDALERRNHEKIISERDSRGTEERANAEQEDLFAAAAAGRIGQILKKRPLSPEEYLQKDEDGKTLITRVAEARQIDLVFEPKNWTNPKDMQTVWDAVPPHFRDQMDGQDGRPSFIKNKTQVMAAAVKSALARKTQNR